MSGARRAQRGVASRGAVATRWLLCALLLAGCGGVDLHAWRLDAAADARKAGRYASALEQYWRLLREDPDDRAALLGLAAVAEAQERPERAVDLYRDVLRRAPGLTEAHVGVVRNTWLAAGDSAALAACAAARTACEEPEAVLLVQARIQRQAGDLESARRSCGEAAAAAPGWAEVAREQALIERALGDSGRALRFAAVAAEAPGARPETLLLYGELLLEAERHRDAVKALEHALPRLASPGPAWRALALARLATGHRRSALAAFWKAEGYGEDPATWADAEREALRALLGDLEEGS